MFCLGGGGGGGGVVVSHQSDLAGWVDQRRYTTVAVVSLGRPFSRGHLHGNLKGETTLLDDLKGEDFTWSLIRVV